MKAGKDIVNFKMNDGSMPDRIFHVSKEGSAAYRTLEEAWKDALYFAKEGFRVLIVVHPGSYPLKGPFELHANLNVHGLELFGLSTHCTEW